MKCNINPTSSANQSPAKEARKGKFNPKIISAPVQSEVLLRIGGLDFSKSSVWVESDNNYGDNVSPTFSESRVWVERPNFYRPAENDEAILIIGFDTEFKPPSEALTRLQVKNGLGKYEVLSYQTWCKLYDDQQPDAIEWGGICYPAPRGRLTIAQVILFTIWKGIQTGALNKVPRQIYLTGHFTRADVPAFADFENLLDNMSALRGTFVSTDDFIPLSFDFEDGEAPAQLNIKLRDTMTLSPQGDRSLRALGDLVGVPKITLDADPEREQFYKENMDLLLNEKPDLFERYALTDSIICVRYMDKMLQLIRGLLGSTKKPHATLTGIGVDLLMDGWSRDGLKADEMLGMETVRKKYWDKRNNRYRFSRETVPLEPIYWHMALAKECYHGGRGEQFWFGPGKPSNWTDYDLSGAYPTAMALMKLPDWRNAQVSTVLSDFTPTTLGVASVTFEFPESVRYPTLPVRTEHGLIFPRCGESNCAAPEIALAVELGAKVTIKHGVIIPPLGDRLVFGDFIKTCTTNRKAQPKGSVDELFWKELTNSTYGKTAQGLHRKRVYDLKERDTRDLPPSPITQPFYAAYITSFVRATLGEVMNRLPVGVSVFSCTTDGFLTDADDDQIAHAQTGAFGKLFAKSRAYLTGEGTVSLSA